MFIPFSDIPGNQKIFVDYLYNFNKVNRFYVTNFANKDEYPKVFKQKADSKKEVNEKIADIIKEQYAGLNTSEKTAENINLLSNKETLAVVTGQQLGIIGGPLYTFYKIITAIKLSNQLNEKYDNYHFVPIFWLEGDDHDFDEIRSIRLVNSANELVKISYNDDLPEDTERGSIGLTSIKETINNFFEETDAQLRNTEFKQELLSELKKFYSPDKSFNQAFKELTFWIFDSYGLVIFDPQDKKTKELLIPIFKKEVNDFRQHSEKLISVSAELEEDYHAQVKVNPLNLFYSTDGGRYSVVPDENIFKLKRKRKRFTYEEIIREIEEHPENFSPNVLLRPICQDYLLPTAFYVAGPSEIAYFAQINTLYNFYQIPHPIIYPRSSATILENNIGTVIEKYNLNFTDVFTDLKSLENKVIKSVSDTSLDEMFDETTKQIEDALSKLKENLFNIDKTISDASQKYNEKILSYMDELKLKASEAQKKKHEITIRQIEKLSTHFYPNSNLQERELNFAYFADKYGMDFIKKLFELLEINQFKHQIINI